MFALSSALQESSCGAFSTYGRLMKESFPFTVWSGLITWEHRSRMGLAIWEFLWLIDKVTREEDGRGIVLGGKPVKLAEIADDLGRTRDAVSDALRRLSEEDYIEVHRKSGGLAVYVLKSKKWSGRRKAYGEKTARREGIGKTTDLPDRESGKTPNQSRENHRSESGKTPIQNREKSRIRIGKNTHSQARMTCTVDSTEDGTRHAFSRPSEKTFQDIAALPEDERRELAAEALEDMASQPFSRSFLIKVDGRWKLGDRPICRSMFQMAMVRVYERRGKATADARG